MDPQNVKDTIQAVVEGLSPLAERLQVPAGKLFEYAIRHNYAKAVSEVVPFVVGGAGWFGVYKTAKKGLSPAEPEGRYSATNFDRDPMGTTLIVLIIVFGLIGVIGTIGGMIDVSDAVTRFIAPEWSAISDLMAMVKGK